MIGCGLSRTGTLSMKLALEELGFSPCHHFIETITGHPERNHFYETHYKDETDKEAVKEFFKGYKATVDHPGNWFYQDFIRWNPEAKVVLTVKDSAESWARSTRATIFVSNTKTNWFSWKIDMAIRCYLGPPHATLNRKISARKFGVDPNHYKTDLVQLYNDWNERVMRTVPAEKLLVFNVKEGWEPLCNFLGVPVPDKPFPRVNSTEQYTSYPGMVKYRRLSTWVPRILLGLGVLVLGVGFEVSCRFLGIELELDKLFGVLVDKFGSFLKF